MNVSICKIHLINYRRFQDFTIEPNQNMNILIGDNESGKSTILEAIDIVVSASVYKVESIGLEKLFNHDAVQNFLNTKDQCFDLLPKMQVDLFLSGNFDYTFNGTNNTEKIECDGIRLICEPILEYCSEINEILHKHHNYFPFEYYGIHFSTFADLPYSGYKKKIRDILIDSSNMNSVKATDDFIKRMYEKYISSDDKARINHQVQYRIMRNDFQSKYLSDICSVTENKKTSYSFGLKNGSESNLLSDLMIYENGVSLDSKGEGTQVFIKTDFALEPTKSDIDVFLLEEPENHLSPVNLRRLIEKFSRIQCGQLFITTHNSFICTRLELNNALLLSKKTEKAPLKLSGLSKETAEYFMKAPPAGIVEFSLSDKTILVEGPSEYMLFDKFYVTQTGSHPENDGVNIIDVRGLSFKRYLEVAKFTDCKVAVVTDNDEDVNKNCIEKYKDYSNCENIKIFYEDNQSLRTFEIVLYSVNKELCDELFGLNSKLYMLNNKTEAAYKFINCDKKITVPEYIRKAIEWIRK